MCENPAEPDGGSEGTTVTVALSLLLWPSYESEEVGPDLACILPVLTGACGIGGGHTHFPEEDGVVFQVCRNHPLWPVPLY